MWKAGDVQTVHKGRKTMKDAANIQTPIQGRESDLYFSERLFVRNTYRISGIRESTNMRGHLLTRNVSAPNAATGVRAAL